MKKNTLRQKRACHKIFIRCDTISDKTYRDEHEYDDFIFSVGQDKDQIEKIITACLEEPLHQMLQQWQKDLKRENFRGNASNIIAEVEAISKELVLTNSKDTDVPIPGTDSTVPGNVKDYLLR